MEDIKPIKNKTEIYDVEIISITNNDNTSGQRKVITAKIVFEIDLDKENTKEQYSVSKKENTTEEYFTKVLCSLPSNSIYQNEMSKPKEQ